MWRVPKNKMLFGGAICFLLLLAACSNNSGTIPTVSTHPVVPSQECLRNSLTEKPVGNHRVTPDSPGALSLSWTYCQDGKYPPSLPALQIADGKAIFSLKSGEIVALDAHSQAHLWSYRTPASQKADYPAVGGGLVYTGISQQDHPYPSQICALDLANGQQRWCQPMKNDIINFWYIDHVLVVRTIDGSATSDKVDTTSILHGLDTTSGRELYQQHYADVYYASSSPAVLFAKDNQQRFLALDYKTGQARWNVPHLLAGPGTQQSVVAAGHLVYLNVIGDRFRDMYALDIETGQERWHTAFDPRGWGPIIDNDQMYILALDERNVITMYALDLQTGRQRWTTQFPGTNLPDGHTLISGNRIYLGQQQDNDKFALLALDTQTGKQVWKTVVDGQNITTGPVLTGGALLIETETTKMYAQSADYFSVLDAQTGKEIP